MNYVCHCSSYRFPHRMGGGKCEAHHGQPLCEDCGQPTEIIAVDYGIGAYEYWGVTGVHRDVKSVSACCESGWVNNNGTHTHQHWFDEKTISRCTAHTAPKPSRV